MPSKTRSGWAWFEFPDNGSAIPARYRVERREGLLFVGVPIPADPPAPPPAKTEADDEVVQAWQYKQWQWERAQAGLEVLERRHIKRAQGKRGGEAKAEAFARGLAARDDHVWERFKEHRRADREHKHTDWALCGWIAAQDGRSQNYIWRIINRKKSES
jgi:hypothetical protein